MSSQNTQQISDPDRSDQKARPVVTPRSAPLASESDECEEQSPRFTDYYSRTPIVDESGAALGLDFECSVSRGFFKVGLVQIMTGSLELTWTDKGGLGLLSSELHQCHGCAQASRPRFVLCTVTTRGAFGKNSSLRLRCKSFQLASSHTDMSIR